MNDVWRLGIVNLPYMRMVMENETSTRTSTVPNVAKMLSAGMLVVLMVGDMGASTKRYSNLSSYTVSLGLSSVIKYLVSHFPRRIQVSCGNTNSRIEVTISLTLNYYPLPCVTTLRLRYL